MKRGQEATHFLEYAVVATLLILMFITILYILKTKVLHP